MISPAKYERVVACNELLEAIGGTGRHFFRHVDAATGLPRYAFFSTDLRGRTWFVDAYSEKPIYTHCTGRWSGFSGGGTLRALVVKLRDYIRTGAAAATPCQLGLGPFPSWVCGGDLWGYGDAMAEVRAAAVKLGLAAADG